MKAHKAVTQEVLDEAIGSLPLLGIIKAQFEGLSEEHRRRIDGARQQIADPSVQFLKEGVDTIDFIIDSAKHLAQCELMLRLDAEARAKVAERKQASRSKP
jgi:ABC-type multidrug transport system ATPase subunit